MEPCRRWRKWWPGDGPLAAGAAVRSCSPLTAVSAALSPLGMARQLGPSTWCSCIQTSLLIQKSTFLKVVAVDWKQELCRAGFTTVLLCKECKLCLCFFPRLLLIPYTTLKLWHSGWLQTRESGVVSPWHFFEGFHCSFPPPLQHASLSMELAWYRRYCLFMPGYFLIGVYSAGRHFYECCILTQWGHWGLNFWLQFTFNSTLHLHVTELYPPRKLFLWQSGSFSIIVWDVIMSNVNPELLRVWNLNTLCWWTKLHSFHISCIFVLYGFHIKASMYSSTTTTISVAWRHISVQSLRGTKWSGLNVFSFKGWLL